MISEEKEIRSILERNAGIQYALLGFLKKKGYLDDMEFVQYCNEVDYTGIRKEIFRGEEAAKSVNDEMHPGGEKATLKLCEIAELKKTECVLDAGTGHGGAARVIAQSYGCKVIGLEVDYVRLINTIFRTKQAGLDDLVSYCTGDAYHMPFADNSFDVVFRQHAVYGQEERVFVQECFRVLKTGGRIAFQGILKRVPLSKSKCNMEDYSVDEYLQLLKDCGFEDIQLETETSSRELLNSLKSTDSAMYNFIKRGLVTGAKIIAMKK